MNIDEYTCIWDHSKDGHINGYSINRVARRKKKKRERSKTIMKIASVGKALTGDKSKMMVL